MGIRKKPESAGINLNPTQKVVTYLLGLLPKAAYHVFLDNLFSSPNLFVILRESGIGASGTARANSGIFKELVEEKKHPDPSKPWGWIRAVPTQDGLVNQMAWKDSQIVLFISTVHASTEMIITKRRRPAKANTPFKKKIWEIFDGQYEKDLPIPVAINEYNHNMNSVDVGDQLLASNDWKHR